MKHYKAQSGSAHLILIIVLILLIFGSLGFIYWQNFMQPKPVATRDIKSTETITTGTIEGSLTYPSEGIPESTIIYAVNIESGKEYSVKYSDTATTSMGKYKIEVPAGDYYVYSVVPEFNDMNNVQHKAYYNQFILCGMSVECTDISKIVVKVTNGNTVSNITVGDWWNIDK